MVGTCVAIGITPMGSDSKKADVGVGVGVPVAVGVCVAVGVPVAVGVCVLRNAINHA